MTRLSGAVRCILIFLVFYGIPNRVTPPYAHDLPLSFIDLAIPLIPWTLLIYDLCFFWSFSPIFLLKSDLERKAYVTDFFWMSLAAGAIFMIYPTQFPTENWPMSDVKNGFWDHFFYHNFHAMRASDHPVNCFPSLHVAYSFLSVRALWNENGKLGRTAMLTLAIAISLSTLTVKQHYFVDVIGGLALFLVVWKLRSKSPKVQALAQETVGF